MNFAKMAASPIALAMLLLVALTLPSRAASKFGSPVPGFDGLRWGMTLSEVRAHFAGDPLYHAPEPIEEGSTTGRWIGDTFDGKVQIEGLSLPKGVVFFYTRTGSSLTLVGYSGFVRFANPDAILSTASRLSAKYPEPPSRRTRIEALHLAWFLDGSAMDLIVFKLQPDHLLLTVRVTPKDFNWR
jgi:hypothetical protein